MVPHRSIPPVILAILTLLTAGFAVLGFTTGPKSDELIVQNGTASTFGSPLGSNSFSLDLTSSVSSGSGSGVLSQVRLIKYRAPDHIVVYQTTPTVKKLGTLGKDTIASVLASYAAVTAGTTPWVRDGSHFVRTESLVSFSARVSHKASAAGKVFETAVVRDGYLVYVKLHAVVPSQANAAGGTVGETFHVLQINGEPAPAVNL